MSKINEGLKRWARLFYLLAATLSLGAGGAVAFIGNEAGNPLIIVVGFGGLAGGFLLVKKWFEHKSTRMVDKRVMSEPPNCLILSRTHILFDYIKEPEKLLGLAQKCYNDGKFYHVLRDEGADNNGHPVFVLPDDDENERHYDPAEMANVVTMPSNKKYFTWSATTMQKISIGIMGIIIAGEIIGVVALG